jgi:hypothetical protein
MMRYGVDFEVRHHPGKAGREAIDQTSGAKTNVLFERMFEKRTSAQGGPPTSPKPYRKIRRALPSDHPPTVTHP